MYGPEGRRTVSTWLLRYEGYDPGTEPVREALCTLGNGRFATRGAAPEQRAGGGHYPGTYAAGVFNRLGADVDGQHVENESIVNLPDWQSLTVRPDGGEWIDVDTMAVSGYVRSSTSAAVCCSAGSPSLTAGDGAPGWRNAG